MLSKIHGFVRMGTAIAVILLIVSALLTVDQGIAQAGLSMQISSLCSGTGAISGMVVDPSGEPLSEIGVQMRSSANQVCGSVTADELGALR